MTNGSRVVTVATEARSSISGAYEREQLARQLLRGVLGEVVTAVDPVTAHVVGPTAPDREDVPVQLDEVVARGPEDEERARDAAAGGAILLVVAAVDPEAGAVVLEHRVDGRRI